LLAGVEMMHVVQYNRSTMMVTKAQCVVLILGISRPFNLSACLCLVCGLTACFADQPLSVVSMLFAARRSAKCVIRMCQ